MRRIFNVKPAFVRDISELSGQLDEDCYVHTLNERSVGNVSKDKGKMKDVLVEVLNNNGSSGRVDVSGSAASSKANQAADKRQSQSIAALKTHTTGNLGMKRAVHSAKKRSKNHAGHSTKKKSKKLALESERGTTVPEKQRQKQPIVGPVGKRVESKISLKKLSTTPGTWPIPIGKLPFFQAAASQPTAPSGSAFSALLKMTGKSLVTNSQQAK